MTGKKKRSPRNAVHTVSIKRSRGKMDKCAVMCGCRGRQVALVIFVCWSMMLVSSSYSVLGDLMKSAVSWNSDRVAIGPHRNSLLDC